MSFTKLLATFFLMSAGISGANAQADWPTKTITIVVPYATDGFSDARFRLLARKLSEKLGQTVILDNKAGAGGVLGTSLVAKAAPDGYTIGVGSFAPLAIHPELMKKVPYDVATDLMPVILIIHVPYKGGSPAATDLTAGHLSMMSS
jgi:tripartite-type tricarboxylate transporter receptor subunit TctC